MLKKDKSILYTTLTIILFLLIIAFSLRPLSNDNEGSYANIAYSMLSHLNYIMVPHLDGLVYLEQPPLLYWFCALSFSIFGKIEIAARIPSLLSGLFFLVSSYYFTKRHFSKETASFLSLVIVAQICFAIMASMLMFDMMFALFFSLSMFSFYLSYAVNKNTIRFFYIFLMLAAFTKGFVAIALAFLVIIPFIIIKKIKLKDLNLGFGILMFAIFSIWFIVVAVKIPAFASYYFINNQVLRFLGYMYPNDSIKGPIYFYLLRLFVCSFPWSILFFFGIYSAIKNLKHKNDLHLFMILWFSAIFIFFSISRGKANYYLLPALYPIAFFIVFAIKNLNLKWFYGVLAVSGFLIFFGSFCIKLHYINPTDSQLIIRLPLVILSSLIFLVYLFVNLKKNLLVEGLAASSAIILITLFLYINLNVNDFTSKYAADWIKPNLNQNTLFVQDKPFWKTSSAVFYLNKESLLLNDYADGDLYYGMSLLKNRESRFINYPILIKLLKKHNVIIISARKKFLKELSLANIKPNKIKYFGNQTVVLINKT